MKVTKNKKLDLAYVQFRKGNIHKTVKIRDDLLIDLDKEGRILGIEVLSLSELAPSLKLIQRGLNTIRSTVTSAHVKP